MMTVADIESWVRGGESETLEFKRTTGERREPGPSGGRPAALFRFRTRTLAITDQFAVLRPQRAGE